MLGSVVLRLGLALIMATSLLMINTSVAGSAGRLVDQDAKITLMPTMDAPVGATGEAELRLRIDEEHMLEIFRVIADAEGLTPDVTYSLFVTKIGKDGMKHHLFIASDVADANGQVSFDNRFDALPFKIKTLLGLKVKIIEGTSIDGKVVLKGTVMEVEEQEVK